jgi:hypothetical protein
MAKCTRPVLHPWRRKVKDNESRSNIKANNPGLFVRKNGSVADPSPCFMCNVELGIGAPNTMPDRKIESAS